ncbi:glutamate--tRNA ligase [bacterium]|nr:glutamate--tRNA ligase [bacterium]
MEVRVRFAPSPTGHLHIGGVRTALFNWLFTKHHKGKFILRIEDTDRKRSTKESIADILESMEWLGLEWDEGPYFQMERLDIYKKYGDKLLKEGKAYLCYCTPEELKERRRKGAYKYDGRCRNLTEEQKREYIRQGRKPALRLRSPSMGKTILDDLVRGKIEFENKVLDDFVLLKSDGVPTYNFACIIDDVLMKVSHVIRGEDHLSNTPRQVLVYQALGLDLPQFAHLPMILGSDHTLLSKRHGAVAVSQYKEMGYLPRALINYLALLGWGTPESKQLFTQEELIERFSLEHVSKNPAVFDPKKLEWMNGHYLKNSDPEEITDLVIDYLKKKELLLGKIDPEKKKWIGKIVETVGERLKYIGQIIDYAGFFFTEKIAFDRKAKEKFLKKEIKPFLKEVKEDLSKIEPFGKKGIEEAIRKELEVFKIKPKIGAQAVRVALTGQTISPPLFEVIELLGKEKTLGRLEQAL